jgi:hypothetical protein
MSVDALASVAVQLSKAAKLENGLREALTKWVAKALKPLLTPAKLSELVRSTSAATVEALLEMATATDLKKLAKALDPHNSGVGAKAPAALSAHIVGLLTGEIDAVPEPPKPENMLRVVSSRAERQAILESLRAPQLRSYIKAEKLRPAGVPPKASKPALVRHILDELDAAEASGPPRLLADSKYRVQAPSR